MFTLRRKSRRYILQRLREDRKSQRLEDPPQGTFAGGAAGIRWEDSGLQSYDRSPERTGPKICEAATTKESSAFAS